MARTRAFIVFLLVRLVAFANDPLLEDHDSVSYLQSAKTLMSLDLDRVQLAHFIVTEPRRYDLAHDEGLISLRHFAVIGPLCMLIEGIGIVALAQAIACARRGPGKRALLFAPGLVVLAIGTVLVPLCRLMFLPGRYNGEYRPADFAIPARLVHDVTTGELRRPARIAARKGYFTYFSDSERVAVPYADYERLVKYLAQNRADFLFLEHREIKGYPFLAARAVRASSSNGCTQGQDAAGSSLELYRFLLDTGGAMAAPPRHER